MLALAVAFVLYWFQPQAIFIDDRVDEAIPTPASSQPLPADEDAAPAAAPPAVTAEPIALTSGAFTSLDHDTTGVVRVLQLADGTRVVRLEGLDTSNGPDLYLYLSTNPAEGDPGAFDDDYLDLGRLKGNQGNQNYDLPPDVDLSHFASVVIWCDRFDSAFGAADLTGTDP